MDNFIFETWISRKLLYFISILSGVRDIFLLGCPQVFSLLNVWFRDISEPYEGSIQRGESFIYIYIYIYKGLEQNLAI